MGENPKIIMGLYKYIRHGKFYKTNYKKVLEEVKDFLKFNNIPENSSLEFLAGDPESADILEKLRLKVGYLFDESELPIKVRRNKAHFMKHYMIIRSLEKHKKILWIDWDNVILKWPDEDFWRYCGHLNTPKFIYIPNYWAVVNCGVCYVNVEWKNSMEKGLELVEEPNDELIWKKILPDNVTGREEFWLGSKAINVWNLDDINLINENTYFAHVRTFEFYKPIIEHIIKLRGDKNETYRF